MRASKWVLVSFILFASLAISQTKSRFNSMDPERRRLFDSWADAKQKATDPASAFDGLSISERTTFDAVTHALSRVKLTAADGRSLGTALGLIDSIEEIAGEYKDKRGDEQFRIYCLLKSDAKQVLAESKQFFHDKDNSVFHKGYPVNFRQSGKMPSIQVSIMRESLRADIDVDYISSKPPQGLFNGHMTAANSDVRARNNFRKHNSRYFGLAAWWRGLFPPSDLAAETEKAAPAHAPSTTPPDRPEGAHIDSASAAVQEFLTDALVRRKIKEALRAISSAAEACVNTDADAENERLNAAQLRKELNGILRAASERLGPRPDLSSSVTAVRPTDQTYRIATHPFEQDFTLADISDQEAAELLCRTQSPAQGPDVQTAYGNWAVAVFRFNVDDSATLELLLKKETGGWRIASYDFAEY